MTRYVCTRCGADPGEVIASRPSLDDRYAVGYCPAGCTPIPVFDPKLQRTRPTNRATVPLIRSDLFRPESLGEHRRLTAERKLVEKALSGDSRLTDAQRAEAIEIQRRWDREAQDRRTA